MSLISSTFTKPKINQIRIKLLTTVSSELYLNQKETRINSLTQREFEDLMSKNLFIELHQDFRSPKNLLFNYIANLIENEDSKQSIPSLKLLIEENDCFQRSNRAHHDDFKDFSKFERKSLGTRKINRFRMKSLGVLMTPETRNQLKWKLQDKNLNFFENFEKKIKGKLVYHDLENEKIERIIEFLNTERGFFINPRTQIRSKAGFYFLRNLCLNLKKQLKQSVNVKFNLRENHTKKDIKAFAEVENIMLIKENIDEKTISRRKSIDKRSIIIEFRSKNFQEEGRSPKNAEEKKIITEKLFEVDNNLSTKDEIYDYDSQKSNFTNNASKYLNPNDLSNKNIHRNSFDIPQDKHSFIKLHNCNLPFKFSEDYKVKSIEKKRSKSKLVTQNSGDFKEFRISLLET